MLTHCHSTQYGKVPVCIYCLYCDCIPVYTVLYPTPYLRTDYTKYDSSISHGKFESRVSHRSVDQSISLNLSDLLHIRQHKDSGTRRASILHHPHPSIIIEPPLEQAVSYPKTRTFSAPKHIQRK